jgi:hypothetical protein
MVHELKGLPMATNLYSRCVSFKRVLAALSGLIIFSLSSAAVPDASAAPILQAGIQHTETLPPMPEQFQPGRRLQQSNQQRHVYWQQIPRWLAGRFYSTVETQKATFNNTGTPAPPVNIRQVVNDDYWGEQSDALGNIWRIEILPHSSFHDNDYMLIEDRRIVFQDDKKVVLRVRRFDVIVDQNQTILQSGQADEIKTILRKPTGIHVDYDIVKYDAGGRPEFGVVTSFDAKRTEEFRPCDSMPGLDVRQSFFDFLQTSGHPELIPPVVR